MPLFPRSCLPACLRAIACALAVVIATVGTPRASSACIWNYLDGFNPAPPCKKADKYTKSRLQQENARIVGKLTAVAGQIQQVEIEIKQWQKAYATATTYQDKLRAVEGDLMSNPLRSMVSAYNRTAMASYVKLSTDGTSLGLHPVDIRASLDSIHDKLATDASYEQLYATARTEFKYKTRDIYRSGHALDDQFHALSDWQKGTATLKDSLRAAGNRNADRYAGETRTSGKAEAEISLTSAAITNLRGTAFDAQATSIQLKMHALQGTVETRRILDEERMRNNPMGVRP
jgi:hypothetical protein